MIAFQVSVNDAPVCVAGVGQVGVLTVILSYTGRKEPLKASGARELPAQAIACQVGGLRKGKQEGYDEHLEWAAVSLQSGDLVSVRVVDTERVDEPASVRVDDPVKNERAKRKYYERLKEELGDATA